MAKQTVEIKVRDGETYRKQFRDANNAQDWARKVCELVWSERGNNWPIRVLVNGQHVRYDNVAMAMERA